MNRRRRRGSSLTEGALVLAVLMVSLIGIIDVGQALVVQQGLAERARAGARYAVVNPQEAGGPQRVRNMVVYNTPTPAPDAAPLLRLAPDMVSVRLADPGTPEARIEVSIDDYPFQFYTPGIAGIYRSRAIRVSLPAEGREPVY